VIGYKLLSSAFLFIMFLQTPAVGQKQLVLIKREHVILRLYPGDEIIVKLKNKTIKRSYINNLFDTALVTHRDTIPFYKIDRIYFKQTKFYNTMGKFFVLGGTAFFVVDLINQGSINVEDKASIACLSAIAVGIPLMVVKKKSQRIGYKYRLRTAEKGSVFYLPETNKGFTSPYITN
jgi:hypothetical protein